MVETSFSNCSYKCLSFPTLKDFFKDLFNLAFNRNSTMKILRFCKKYFPATFIQKLNLFFLYIMSNSLCLPFFYTCLIIFAWERSATTIVGAISNMMVPCKGNSCEALLLCYKFFRFMRVLVDSGYFRY